MIVTEIIKSATGLLAREALPPSADPKAQLKHMF